MYLGRYFLYELCELCFVHPYTIDNRQQTFFCMKYCVEMKCDLTFTQYLCLVFQYRYLNIHESRYIYLRRKMAKFL